MSNSDPSGTPPTNPSIIMSNSDPSGTSPFGGDGASLIRQEPTPPSTNTNTKPADVATVPMNEDVQQQQELLEKGGMKGGEITKGDNDTTEEWESFLSEDVYSLLYTAELWSQAFFYSVFWIAFQWTMLALVMYDLLNAGTKSNPLSIPPGVPLQVMICQAFSLVLAVAMADDLLTALVYLHRGYFRPGAKHMPGATKAKWYLATSSHLIAGVSLLFVIFVLVMQSSNIIGMFLNFAALQFLSEVDDVAFKLAAHGFVTHSLVSACKALDTVQIPSNREAAGSYRRILFSLTTVGLLAGYGVLVHQQLSGDFLCQNIFVQFGDDFGTPYSAFSGVFTQTNDLIAERVTYVEKRRDGNPEGAGRIGYCESDKAWTLYLDGKDPCNWVTKSPETVSFDITTTAATNWLTVHPKTDITLAYLSFYLTCNDCGDSDLCPSTHGTCTDNSCVCNPDRYGVNCEFETPCEELTVDFRQGGFPPLEGGLVETPQKFFLLRDNEDNVIQEYDKPVYASAGYYAGIDVAFIIRFTGRRYAMVLSPQDLDNRAYPDVSLLDEFLSAQGNFHAYYSAPFYPYFLSAPMDAGSSSDALTPEGLGWLRSRGNVNEESKGPVFDAGAIAADISFLCSICNNDTNPCLNDHSCDTSTDMDNTTDITTTTDRCSCLEPFYIGTVCEYAQDCNTEGVGCFDDFGECGPDGRCACPENRTGLFCEYEFV